MNFTCKYTTPMDFEPLNPNPVRISPRANKKANENSINHRTDIANLSLIYNSIIQ